MAEEKFLDDIGDAGSGGAPEPAASPEPRPAAEPPIKVEAEPAERTDPANSAARPEGYVPRQALEEARREAKEHRDRAAILEDRTNKILERYFSDNPPAQQAEPEVDLGPDPDEDPIGALKWAREQRARDIEERRQATAAHEQRTEQQRQMSQLAQTARSDVQQFKAATPDYDDARLFYWNQRGPELMALGYSQDQAVQIIEQDELSITAWSWL